MKQRLLVFALNFLVWVIFFVVARTLFLIYHNDLTAELTVGEILLTFAHGLRMDMAMAGYLTLLPGLLLSLFFFIRGKYLWPVWFGHQMIWMVVTSLIIVFDFELYKHWGFRLDATPLMYIGKEAAGSGDFWTSVLLLVFWLIIAIVGILLSKRIFKNRIQSITPSHWATLPLMLFLTATLIIPIRGSFGVAPMNTGFVYFHNSKVFANHAAVNVVWNFGYAVKKMNALKYPETFETAFVTKNRFNELYPDTHDTKKLINTDRPNIIVIVLESYTFRFIKPMGGLPDIAPRFTQLVKEGILFNNFYSSGDRTDKGIVSVLNGYPSQPLTSIIKEPRKTKNLPYLNKVFKAAGYRTEFTYGYNINYANFKSYLVHGEFDHLTHSDDFPQELNTSKWGVHDHYVFERFLEEANAATQPFFKVMMTQSSHEPFDVPMETVIEGQDAVNMFLNSAYYTDKSLGDFIDHAKQQPWWDNTWIIITADHGHHMPDNKGLTNPNRFRIPMLWLGGALTVRDTVITTLSGHTDIPNTILAQVDRYDPSFIFSHNILSEKYDPFAMYIFNNGFGFMRPDKRLVFDHNANNFIEETEGITEADRESAKAYMQRLYTDYNSR